MKRSKRILEYLFKSLFTLSGMVTSITILLIVIFLFKEGFGLLGSSPLGDSHALYVNSKNSIKKLAPTEIKQIFDAEITNWKEVGGEDHSISLFRFEEIFELYSDEQLGEDYELIPSKLRDIISENPNIIAYLPKAYAPTGAKEARVLTVGTFKLGDVFLGREWIPTGTPVSFFGILPLILGTFLVSIVAMLIALPLGLGVAIYLSELADLRIRRLMKPMIELLSGIPSVVYGFFGLVVLVPIVQNFFRLPVGETSLTGSLVLAIMALPTIISLAEDAMHNTPRAIRENSLALGATHWQTICRVVIPYSASGISAAVVLGMGRAIGETMAVLMVTGNAAVIPHSIFDPIRTIPASIAAELGEAEAGGAHYHSLFILGCVLFIINMLMSILAEIVSKQRNQTI